MADLSDRITDVRNATRPVSTTVASPRTAGGTTLTAAALTGWPTASKVHGVTYQIDSNSNPVAGTQIDFSGIVSGSTITQFTVLDGTDTGNSIGDVVEMLPTASWAQDLADALTNQHTRTGGHKNVTTDTLVVSSSTTLPAGDIGTADLASGAVTFSKLAAGATRLGLNNNAGALLTTSYVTFATVTATSTGGVCEAEFHLQANNTNSGNYVEIDIRVLCDGVPITPATLNYNLPFITGASPNYSVSYIMSSTPAAGSHTWDLQVKANTGSSGTLVNNQLKVSEVK